MGSKCFDVCKMVTSSIHSFFLYMLHQIRAKVMRRTMARITCLLLGVLFSCFNRQARWGTEAKG